MFGHLTDLSFQRSRKQAIGFYLATLLSGGILAALVAYIYMRTTGMPVPKKGDFEGAMAMVQQLRPIVVPVVLLISTVLAFLIIKAKRTYGSIALACVGLAAVLSFAGALFSFIPVAYLTTLPKGN